MFVADILKRKGSTITTVSPDQPIAEALALMAQHRIGAVLAVDGGGSIAGILSERDLVRAMNKNGKAVFDKTVGDLMTSPVVTLIATGGSCPASASLMDAAVRGPMPGTWAICSTVAARSFRSDPK